MQNNYLVESFFFYNFLNNLPSGTSCVRYLYLQSPYLNLIWYIRWFVICQWSWSRTWSTSILFLPIVTFIDCFKFVEYWTRLQWYIIVGSSISTGFAIAMKNICLEGMYVMYISLTQDPRYSRQGRAPLRKVKLFQTLHASHPVAPSKLASHYLQSKFSTEPH